MLRGSLRGLLRDFKGSPPYLYPTLLLYSPVGLDLEPTTKRLESALKVVA